METVIIGLVLLYFVPSIVAQARGKRNKAAIFILNVFAGWTFIGWIVALVWASTMDTEFKNGGATNG